MLLNLIKKEECKIKNKQNRAKLNLVYNNYFIFYKYENIEKFAQPLFDSKRNDLIEFKNKLELFYHDTIKIKPNNEDQIKDLEKRKVVMTKASELYDKLLSIYKTQSDNLTTAHKKRMKVQVIPQNLPIDLYLDEYEDDLPSTTPLEGDEEVKSEPEEGINERMKLNPQKRKRKGTELKILTPNKSLTKLPILLAQIKAGNNSFKLRNEIGQILCLLYQHNKITEIVYNNLIKLFNHGRKYDCDKISENLLL